MQQEQSSSFVTCCSRFAMFAAFCSAGESTCKNIVFNIVILVIALNSTVFTIVSLMQNDGITWPGMARAVESLVAMARWLIRQMAGPAWAKRGRAWPGRSIHPIEGQEEEDSHNPNGVAWQEAGRASCTVCQYSPPIGRASFHASANGSAPDAPRRSSSTEVDCSHTQYKGRENIYCLFIGLRSRL